MSNLEEKLKKVNWVDFKECKYTTTNYTKFLYDSHNRMAEPYDTVGSKHMHEENAEKYSKSSIVEIWQRELAITRAADIKPILATYGLASCWGFLGYNLDEKIGFLGHIDKLTDLNRSLSRLTSALQEISHKDITYSAKIVGGKDTHDSDTNEIFESIRKDCQFISGIKINVVAEKVKASTIVLDTKSGETSFNSDRVFHRPFTEKDRLFSTYGIMFPSPLEIIYVSK